MSSRTPTPPRMLTPEELGNVIREWREERRWSQEQLAAIAGVAPRTVQRVERGEGASVDTRRALAGAFSCADLDLLTKPLQIPSAEDLEAAQADFDRTFQTLPAAKVVDGKALAHLAETHMCDESALCFDASMGAESTFAALLDLFRDYRDLASDLSQLDKIDMWQSLQQYLDDLRALDVVLYWAGRTVQAHWGSNGKLHAVEALHLHGFPAAAVPQHLVVPRTMRIGI